MSTSAPGFVERPALALRKIGRVAAGAGAAAIPRPAEAALVVDYPAMLPIKPCANPRVNPAHAKGLNGLYADSHAVFNPFGSQTNASPWDPCVYVGGADHGWQGYFEE